MARIPNPSFYILAGARVGVVAERRHSRFLPAAHAAVGADSGEGRPDGAGEGQFLL